MGISILKFIISVFIFELIGNFILFPILNKLFKKKYKEESGNVKESKEVEMNPRLKGTLERVCLSTALVLGLQSILIAFGALKIGTRLSPTNRKKVANDYFLLGNLLSVFITLLEYACWKSDLFTLGRYIVI